MAIHGPESVKKVSAPFIVSVKPVTKCLGGKSLSESSLMVTYAFFTLNEDLLVCLQLAFNSVMGESRWEVIGMDCNPPGSGMNRAPKK